jgi:prepilin-type N-terminal cleavage/methylation domain
LFGVVNVKAMRGLLIYQEQAGTFGIGRARSVCVWSPQHRERGFTLIEVMITVAIVAILAAIALPSYSTYVQRSKIIEATSNLSDMRTRLEQYFLDNRQYPGACIAAAAGAAPVGKIYLPATMKYFNVTCAFPTAQTYTITAGGVSSESMSGFSYTIDQTNTHKTTGLPTGWSGTGSTCWVIRKDGSC